MLGTMTLFKLIITIIIIIIIIIKIMTIIIVIIISTTMFQNVTEKLETFCFHMFWGVITAKGCYMLPTGKKRYYKITADHK